MLGIDTPEKGKRAKCEREAKLGDSATKMTSGLINNANVIIFSKIKWDKFGGRVLAKINIDGEDLGLTLIRAGMAREYHGEKKKSWCK